MPFSFVAGKQPLLAIDPAAGRAIERVGVKSMNAASTDDTRRAGATQVRIRPQMASIAGWG